MTALRASRALLYVEVPRFYAQVERLRNPELSARPIVVGGDPRKRGQVQAASAEALAAGVVVGMSMLDALARCPRARALRTDMPHYREVSGRLRAVLRAVLGELEPVGLEAAYADATGRDAAALGLAACARIRAELGLAARSGVAAHKFLARIAAESAPDAGVVAVASGDEARFLAPMSVGVLPGVGPKTVATLRDLGAKSIGDLARIDRAALEAALGNHGLRILELARGEDDQPLRAARAPRSLSQESTFDEPQSDLAAIEQRIERLATGLAAALGRQGLRAGRVALKLRFADHERATRSRSVDPPVAAAGALASAALALLGRTHAGERAVRTVGIQLAALTGAGGDDRQLDLFEPSRHGEGSRTDR